MEYEKDPGWQYLRRTREQMIEVCFPAIVKENTKIFRNNLVPMTRRKIAGFPMPKKAT